VWWVPKIGKSPRVKYEFGCRQQCVVKDRDNFKANVVNLFVSSFYVCFLVPFTELFGQTMPFYRVLRSTPKEAFPDSFQKT
jgi:hypothetical protein